MITQARRGRRVLGRLTWDTGEIEKVGGVKVGKTDDSEGITHGRTESNRSRGVELQRLLEDAYMRVLPFIYKSTPQQKLYTIWRRTEGGESAYTMALPNAVSIWEPFTEALHSGGLDQIINYLWEHGTPRITMTGRDPNREAWARWAVNTVIRPMLVQWLEDTFITNACNGQQASTWPIPMDDTLDKLSALHARLLAEDEVFVSAHYFVPAFQMPVDHEFITLGRDITLRTLSQEERLTLLSQVASHLLWDDMFGAPLNDTLCEIKMWVRRSDMGLIMDGITERLNAFKLALTLVQPNLWKNGEGVVLVSIQSPNNYRGISRLLRRRSTQWAGFQPNDEVVEQLRAHIDELQRSVEDVPDLKAAALWRLGRACSADLPRDQLVEAVIGMESLLVPGPGESTYRFELHGTAVHRIAPVLRRAGQADRAYSTCTTMPGRLEQL